MFVTRNLLCFYCFAAGYFVDRCFLFMRCYIYYRLGNACIANTCDRIFLTVFHLTKKKRIRCHYLHFVSPNLSAGIATDRSIWCAEWRAWKTHTLTAILIKVAVTNGLKPLLLSAYEKHFAVFPFPQIFDSLLFARNHRLIKNEFFAK